MKQKSFLKFFSLLDFNVLTSSWYSNTIRNPYIELSRSSLLYSNLSFFHSELYIRYSVFGNNWFQNFRIKPHSELTRNIKQLLLTNAFFMNTFDFGYGKSTYYAELYLFSFKKTLVFYNIILLWLLLFVES